MSINETKCSQQSQQIEALSLELGQLLMAKGWVITTAESCTGGGVAQAITEVSGSSQWFSHGFVTYSNQAKQQLLDIEEQVFIDGAVSRQVVEAMSSGALKKANADVAVAVSGIAGPSGGTPEKPVGTVWISWKMNDNVPVSQHFLFDGDRKSVRNQTVMKSLQGMIETIKNTV